jgi:tRNA threonylcarbamoyladenosine biosynthesis protein TsaB
MLILNIETTTNVGSVSLSKDGFTWVLIEEKERGDHAGQLTIFIQQILNIADKNLSEVDAIAVSEGPGSYTGLRIGVSAAKGICYTLDKPLIAVNTLKTMAYAVGLYHTIGVNDIIVSLQDARRMDAYAAVYDKDLNEIKASFFLTLESDSFLDLIPKGAKLWVCGNSAEKWKTLLSDPRVIFSDVKAPSSRFLEKLSAEAFENKAFEDVAYFEPFYLKPPNVTKPKALL